MLVVVSIVWCIEVPVSETHLEKLQKSWFVQFYEWRDSLPKQSGLYLFWLDILNIVNHLNIWICRTSTDSFFRTLSRRTRSYVDSLDLWGFPYKSINCEEAHPSREASTKKCSTYRSPVYPGEGALIQEICEADVRSVWVCQGGQGILYHQSNLFLL